LDKFRKYRLDLFNLKIQAYNYTFEVDDDFFNAFETDMVEGGKLSVELKLSKSETMIQLHFSIQGSVCLICDRSLEGFDYPINTQEKLILKYGETAEQVDDNLEIITTSTTEINLAQYIYEFILVNVPMKKLHPRFQENDNDELYTLIYSSETDTNIPTDTTTTQSQETETDPRWSALKNLKK
jgi:uncharacterized metal-binding protein YceD (DUF177 family)